MGLYKGNGLYPEDLYPSDEIRDVTCKDQLEQLQNEIKRTKFEIKHGAGLMDFSITNASYVFWELADGTTSTLDKPSVTLSAGTSILYADFYKSDIEIGDNNTNANYIGNICDFPQLTNTIVLKDCVNLTGDIANLPNLTNILNLFNCTSITGDITNLPNLTSDLNLGSCANLTGDIANLPNLTSYLKLSSCINITGVLTPHPTLTSIFLQNTSMTSLDTDGTIINLRNITTIISGGVLQIKANRTSASDDAFNYLSVNGWTITEI